MITTIKLQKLTTQTFQSKLKHPGQIQDTVLANMTNWINNLTETINCKRIKELTLNYLLPMRILGILGVEVSDERVASEAAHPEFQRLHGSNLATFSHSVIVAQMKCIPLVYPTADQF